MSLGAFTNQFDLPLLLVIAFFLFFLGLVYHLQQESKREGYPLVAPDRRNGRVTVVGFPAMPKPKTFILPHGRPPVQSPRAEEPEVIDAQGVGNPTGEPIVPNGNPLLSKTGPAAWVAKVDEPDLSYNGDPVFRPMRYATGFKVHKYEADPRGFDMLGLDKQVAGRVVDIWVDESEHTAKFLEIELSAAIAGLRDSATYPARSDRPADQVIAVAVIDEIVDTPVGPVETVEVDVITAPRPDPTPRDEQRDRAPAAPDRVLLPMGFAAIDGRARTVRTAAITAAQFADVPGRRADLTLTAREENRIRGYYGGGFLWATPARTEPLI